MTKKASQYAGTIRRSRRAQNDRIAGRAAPPKWARANGRYSRKPEITKKTETPISSRHE